MEMKVEKHLEEFVEAFVQKHRRKRWHFLFQKNDTKTYHNAHKLLKDLDKRFKVLDNDLESLKTKNFQGVFYEIGREEPQIDNLQKVLEKRYDCMDAIFSIKPGNLAIFFYHESQRYILKK